MRKFQSWSILTPRLAGRLLQPREYSMELSAADVVARFQKNTLNRREAVRSLLRMGFTAPAAYSALGVLAASTAPASAQSTPYSSEALQRLSQGLFNLVKSPEMVSAMESASKKEDKREVARILIETAYKPQLMEKCGLKTSELRTSMRVFELRETGEVTFGTGRSAGQAWVYKPSNAGQPVQITDKETLEASAKAGSEFAKKELEALGQPKDLSGICVNCGICVSYGIDLCVTAGIP